MGDSNDFMISLGKSVCIYDEYHHAPSSYDDWGDTGWYLPFLRYISSAKLYVPLLKIRAIKFICLSSSKFYPLFVCPSVIPSSLQTVKPGPFSRYSPVLLYKVGFETVFSGNQQQRDMVGWCSGSCTITLTWNLQKSWKICFFAISKILQLSRIRVHIGDNTANVGQLCISKTTSNLYSMFSFEWTCHNTVTSSNHVYLWWIAPCSLFLWWLRRKWLVFTNSEILQITLPSSKKAANQFLHLIWLKYFVFKKSNIWKNI